MKKREGILVGKWCFINGYVELRYDKSLNGGTFYQWPADEGNPYLVVGGSEGRAPWHKVMGVFQHELWEYGMMARGLRFKPDPELVDSHASYIFSMNHEQFAEVASECGYYLCMAMPPLAKIWTKERKKK